MDYSVKDIAEGLKRRIEYLIDSGITAVPVKSALKAPASPSVGWGFFEGALGEAASFSPCGHNDWKGVLFAVFPLSKAAVLWGVPVSGQGAPRGFLRPESLKQLEKMLEWLSGELGSPAPDVHDPRAVIAAWCPGGAPYSDAEAALASVEAVERLLVDKMVLLMGELACWAFLRTAGLEEARGELRRAGSRKAIVTYSPDELVADPGLKRAVHADLKLLISSCRA